MSNQTQTELMSAIDENPEIRSFVYQQILEFEPYVTPQTIVAVIARDPMKLVQKMEAAGEDVDRDEFSQMYRIAIILKEDGSKIQEEALHRDIYTAIRLAKEKLIKKLEAIQDHIVSQSDRMQQINSALTAGKIH
jgi:ribosome-associated translation inhibitor RaiA